MNLLSIDSLSLLSKVYQNAQRHILKFKKISYLPYFKKGICSFLKNSSVSAPVFTAASRGSPCDSTAFLW